MTNISAMKALAELNKVEASRNQNVAENNAPQKSTGFSLFGFGFKNQAVNPDNIPPEEKGFNMKS